MRYLDLTLPTAEENLALDEALLEEAEQSDGPQETLRLWEPGGLMVVVGRSSKTVEEVRCEVCGREGIPVLRRVSGGATVVSGPGCLMYALVLSFRLRPDLRAVDLAHQYVLETLAEALRPLAPGIGREGTSDLAVRQGDRMLKVSGNSVRMRREHLLYHGTLLYDFPLEMIDRLLAMPPRQPEYRDGRSHGSFLANLPVPVSSIRGAVATAWGAVEPAADWPRRRVAELVAERYGRAEWNQ